jgi:hypothetical protein
MPPRKPKQPARKPAAKRGASKKTKAASQPDFNPDTHLLGGDGQVYEKKTVSGAGSAVGVNNTTRTAAHEEIEKKMSQAILQAHADGITDPKEIQSRIMKARQDHLDGNS